jgi:hypothetical protein
MMLYHVTTMIDLSYKYPCVSTAGILESMYAEGWELVAVTPEGEYIFKCLPDPDRASKPAS